MILLNWCIISFFKLGSYNKNIMKFMHIILEYRISFFIKIYLKLNVIEGNIFLIVIASAVLVVMIIHSGQMRRLEK